MVQRLIPGLEFWGGGGVGGALAHPKNSPNYYS